MQANSVLGNARAVDGLLEDLLGFRRLAGRRGPTAYAAAIRATLDDLVVLLAACAPAPAWREDGTRGTASGSAGRDAALGDLLWGLYEDGTATVETLAGRIDGGKEEIAALAGEARIERVGEYVVVPLVGPRAGDNWRVLLDVLVDVLGEIHRKAKRVDRRVRADGDRADGTFDRVADRIGVLAETLDRLDGFARNVGRLSTRDRRVLRSLRRLLDRYDT